MDSFPPHTFLKVYNVELVSSSRNQDLRQMTRKEVLTPCCCSVVQSSPTLCDPTDCSTPGFPVLHHLLELAQTHVHWVSDAILPSHPLSSPSPSAFNFSKHQGLFSWVSSLHQVATVLELELQQHMSAVHVSTWRETIRLEWRIPVLSHAHVLPCSFSYFTDFLSYEFQTCLSNLLNHMS